MTAQELERFHKLCRLVKKLPAFSKVIKSIRRKPLKDLLAYVYEDSQGKFNIVIAKNETFQNAIDDLAHELAHVLVDMSNAHGPLFTTMEFYMKRLLSDLLKTI
ncbi:MAG: hypothetical protein ACPL1K_03340 [Candidatus Kryptoniota bacterium]